MFFFCKNLRIIRAFRLVESMLIVGYLSYILSNDSVLKDWLPGDDAFISFNYARNFALGQGLAFNPGEYVWGFTSPLQTSVLALMALLGADPIKVSCLLSIVWTAATTFAVFEFGARILNPWVGFLLSASFITNGTAYHYLGLESSLLVFLQIMFLLQLMRGSISSAAVFAGFANLVRPDSLILTIPVMMFSARARRIQPICIMLLPGIVWLVFAYSYYGVYLPNSLYAKQGLSSFLPYLKHSLSTVIHFALQDFAPGNLVFGLAVSAGMCMMTLISRSVRSNYCLIFSLTAYPFLLLLGYSVIGSYTGHDWEYYSASFFCRLSAGIGVYSVIVGSLNRLRKQAGFRICTCLLSALAIGGCTAICLHNVDAPLNALQRSEFEYYNGKRYSQYLEIANWINNNIASTASVACGEVGIIGYYTQVRIIDISGIVTSGYQQHERMQTIPMLKRYRPDYAVLFGHVPRLNIDKNLEYDLVHYFKSSGYSDFSMLKRCQLASSNQINILGKSR